MNPRKVADVRFERGTNQCTVFKQQTGGDVAGRKVVEGEVAVPGTQPKCGAVGGNKGFLNADRGPVVLSTQHVNAHTAW